MNKLNLKHSYSFIRKLPIILKPPSVPKQSQIILNFTFQCIYKVKKLFFGP